jgi:disease resistance protein RPM1
VTLGRLTNLRKLSIAWNTDGMEGDIVRYKVKLVSTLCKLDACNLSSLSIDFNLRENDGLVGDSIFCPALNSIREVYLLCGGVHQIRKWLVSLDNLECLHIEVMEIDNQDIHAIGSIPSLLEFRMLLSGYCDVRVINIRGGFQKLQNFSFQSECTGLMIHEGAMSLLRGLQLHIHPVEFKLHGYDFGLQHLPCISRVGFELNCAGVRAADVEAAEAAFNCMVEKHTKKTLTGDHKRTNVDHFT